MAGQAAHALAAHGVPLVRHRRGPDLGGFERLFDFLHNENVCELGSCRISSD